MIKDFSKVVKSLFFKSPDITKSLNYSLVLAGSLGALGLCTLYILVPINIGGALT